MLFIMSRKIALLFSGGLDSATLLHKYYNEGWDVHCVLVDYGQPHAQELVFAKGHCRLLGTQFTLMSIPYLGGMTEDCPVVFNRNAIILHLAANFACQIGCEIVLIGCNKSDAALFHDCRAEFIESVNTSLSLAGVNVQIQAPFIGMLKAEIASLAKTFGVNRENTWTCYRGGSSPCGECDACIKLENAYVDSK